MTVTTPTTTNARSEILSELEPRRLRDYIVDKSDRGRNRIWMITWLGVGAVLRSGVGGTLLRSSVLRTFGAHVGARCDIHRSFRVHFPWKLDLDEGVRIDRDVWIINPEPVSIGADCSLGPRTVICSGGHDHRSPTFTRTSESVVISARCHLGNGVTVLKGVVLQPGTRVPAGAVVIPSISAKSRRTTSGGRP
ncbi:acetyltransferase [Gordonia sp. NPDC057258]|uniref:acetyltransferase n=1 Tax=unclassified Gordonia (in: high G+C Gram-positive bacteria) TaxID=2657482 RepID=UPI00362854E1